MPTILLVIIAQITIFFVYIRLADKLNIVDRPNQRSSHSYVTIRGGGIVFPISVILWFLLTDFNYPWIVFALLSLAIVSFFDDIKTLSPKIRITVQLISVIILFWQVELFQFQWYMVILVLIICIGWINTFNFMDGINGITAIYSFVALGSFTWLNQRIQFAPQELVNYLVIAVLIFSFFNVRKKAKTFAGDVGSISMAFILAWFMLSLIIKTGRFEYILFFAVYGIDSVLTILLRLIRRENIFRAHRSHLYQYLSNELRWPHVLVSAIYGIAQITVNIGTIYLISSGEMNWMFFISILTILTVGYLVVRSYLKDRINFMYNFV